MRFIPTFILEHWIYKSRAIGLYNCRCEVIPLILDLESENFKIFAERLRILFKVGSEGMREFRKTLKELGLEIEENNKKEV